MKRPFAFAALVAVAFALTSCFQTKAVITVNKGGTATIEEVTLLSAQLRSNAGGNDGPGNGGAVRQNETVRDRAGAEERARNLGGGVTVQSFEEINLPDGRGGVRVIYAAADIRKLTYLLPASSASKADKASTRPLAFALENGTLTVTSPPDNPKDISPTASAGSKEQMISQFDRYKPLIAGMRVTVEVKSSSGIASSDATHVVDDTVTLIDLDFDKLLEKPEALAEMLLRGDELGQSETAEKYKDVPGFKMEGKKTFQVVLK